MALKGRVKFFSDEKGWGFIQPEDKSKDVFVHQTAILMEGRRTLNEGDEVEFEVEQSNRGARAINVRKL